MRLIVGSIALALRGALAVAALWRPRRAARAPAAGSPTFWSAVAGYTSFVAHAGGPPYQVYTMPLRREPRVYTGTSVIFFAVVNVVKLVPYAALGQLAADNLATSAVLMPVAGAATLAGAWVVGGCGSRCSTRSCTPW